MQHSRIVVWLKYYGPSVIVFVTIALQNLYILYNFFILSLSLCFCLHNICSWVREHSLGLGAFPWCSLSYTTPTHSVFCLTLSHSFSLSHTYFLNDIDSDENISRIAKSTNRCFTQCSESSFFSICSRSRFVSLKSIFYCSCSSLEEYETIVYTYNVRFFNHYYYYYYYF